MCVCVCVCNTQTDRTPDFCSNPLLYLLGQGFFLNVDIFNYVRKLSFYWSVEIERALFYAPCPLID